MPSFLIEPGQIKADRALIRDKEAHHILRVLRLVAGDEISLFDGKGNRYRARIEKTAPRLVEARIMERYPPSGQGPHLALFQCLPRPDKMDIIVQKAVELGAGALHPLISERSWRTDEVRLENKRQRWQRIAAAAAKQCGQSRLPEIEAALSLKELPAGGAENALSIVLYEASPRSGLKEILRARQRAKTINLLVGPEGGLDQEETAALARKGWLSAGLGTRILRTETASLAGLAIIQYELGDLSY